MSTTNVISSAQPVKTFSTEHQDMIHDAQADYYGKRIATCSSDSTIKIFDISPSSSSSTIENQEPKLLEILQGHEGPVWQVQWGHPSFGSILASCSYDHRVIIWKENPQNHKWSKIYEYRHDSSVNSISWAPHEHGLRLASASSDCKICILSFNETNNNWEIQTIKDAHKIGCNAVSWAPAILPGPLISENGGNNENLQVTKRLVSGGSDSKIHIWELNESKGEWALVNTLDGHGDWVRDVAWAPNIGLPFETIASCSQDKTAIVWTREQQSNQWSKQVLSFDNVVWRVSWSLTGNILAISTADNEVTLWKEDVDGQFKKISSLSQ